MIWLLLFWHSATYSGSMAEIVSVPAVTLHWWTVKTATVQPDNSGHYSWTCLWTLTLQLFMLLNTTKQIHSITLQSSSHSFGWSRVELCRFSTHACLLLRWGLGKQIWVRTSLWMSLCDVYLSLPVFLTALWQQVESVCSRWAKSLCLPLSVHCFSAVNTLTLSSGNRQRQDKYPSSTVVCRKR